MMKAIICATLSIIATLAQAEFTCKVSVGKAASGAVREGTITWKNTGSTAVAAPYVRLNAGDGVFVRFTETDQWTKSLEFLATSSGAQASVLKGYEKGELTFLCKSSSDDDTMELSYTLASAEAFPWADVENSLKPSFVSDTAWVFALRTLKARLGSTWDSYLGRFRADVDYLAALGRPVNRMDRLWQFEINCALGNDSAVPTLASAVDAARSARGLGLTLSRSYSSAMYARFNKGMFGSGWTDNLSVYAELTGATTLTFHMPDGGSYSFTKVTGNWAPEDARDKSTLLETSSAYVLTYQNGTKQTFAKSNMRTSSIADNSGNALTFTWNGTQLVKVAHTDGQSLTFAYSGGLVVSVTDDCGRQATYAYSGELLTSVTASDGLVTQYEYRAADGTAAARALSRITYPDGTTKEFEYDAEGLVASVSINGGQEKTSIRRADGVITLIQPDGGKTVVKTGVSGEALETKDALGGISVSRYTEDGLLKSMTAPSGLSGSVLHDALGRVAQSMSAGGQATAFAYEETFGNLKTVTDAKSHAVTYGYDAKGRGTSVSFPDGSMSKVEYNDRGDVVKSYNRRGESIAYTYDARGRVTKKTWSTGRTFTYAYDAHGNVTTATDSETGSVTMEYDAADRMTKIAYPNGRGFTFAYDSEGRLTRRAALDGAAERFLYDQQGRLSVVAQDNGGSGMMYLMNLYDQTTGRLYKQLNGNGTSTSYLYDKLGRVTSIEHCNAEGRIIEALQYCYDVDGRCIRASSLLGEERYGYDADGQLTAVDYPNNTYQTYAYDAVGNMISNNAAKFTVNAMNQYMKIVTAADEMSLTYDTDGNLTSTTDSNGTTTYTYDTLNRLTAVKNASAGIDWSCKYDVFGNRVSVTDKGVTTERVYLQGSLPSVAAEYVNGQLKERHILVGALRLADVDADGQAKYLHADLIGSVRLVTGDDGTVQDRASYLAFGGLRTGSVESSAGYVGTLGVETDSTGLLFMRNRYYSPTLGRFIQPDPIGLNGGDENWYRYCGNNCLSRNDVNGCFSLSGLGKSIADEFVFAGKAMWIGVDAGMRFWPNFLPGGFVISTLWSATVDYYSGNDAANDLASGLSSGGLELSEHLANSAGEMTKGWERAFSGMKFGGNLFSALTTGYRLVNGATELMLKNNGNKIVINVDSASGDDPTPGPGPSGGGTVKNWADWDKIWAGGAGSSATYSLDGNLVSMSLSAPYLFENFSGTIEGNGYQIIDTQLKPIFKTASGATFNNVDGITIFQTKDCVFNNCRNVTIYEDNSSVFNNSTVCIWARGFITYFNAVGIDYMTDDSLIGCAYNSDFSNHCNCIIDLSVYGIFADSEVDIAGAFESTFLRCSGSVEVAQGAFVVNSPNLSVKQTITTKSTSVKSQNPERPATALSGANTTDPAAAVDVVQGSAGCSVKGTGSYKKGETVTLTAMPSTDSLFDGWYSDPAFTERVSADATYSFTVEDPEKRLYAKFSTKESKLDATRLYSYDKYVVQRGQRNVFLVDGTAPIRTTLTVSGLPSGFEFYDDYLMIVGTPTRTMSTTITVTLTNAAGTKTKKIPFVVVAPEDEDEDPACVDFVETEMTVAEGEKAKVAVWGGSADGPCDVKLYLAPASADAKDLDLTKLTVDGVAVKNAKFPLTLSWAAGDVSEKVVEIPIKADTAVEGYEQFDLQLADANGIGLGDACLCSVSVKDETVGANLAQAVNNPSIKVATSGDGKWIAANGNEGYIAGDYGMYHLQSPALASGKTSTLNLSGVSGSGQIVVAYRFVGDYTGGKSASLRLLADKRPLKTDTVLYHSSIGSEWKTFTITDDNKGNHTYSYVFTQGDDPNVHVEVAMAKWVPAGGSEPVMVYVSSNGSGYGTVSGMGFYAIGATAKITAKPAPGRQFAGWYKYSNASQQYELYDQDHMTLSIKVTESLNLRAVFLNDPYVRAVALPADGGKVSGSGYVASGKKVTLKATANKNFTFEGWYASKTDARNAIDESHLVATTASLVIDRGTKPTANSKTSTTVTDISGDVTYFAKFKSYPEAFVSIEATDGNVNAGKITGAGKYAPGKKVTLKATANKGYAFAGWYDGGAGGGHGVAALPTGEPVSRLASYVLTMPTNDVAFTAKFVTAEEDAASIGATVADFAFGAAAEDGGSTGNATNVMCGVYLEWPVAASALSEPTVTVSGLPSGLKFTAKPVTAKVGSGKTAVTVTNVFANTIYGAPSAASKTDKYGVVSPSKVKVTVTTAGKSKAEYVIDLTVDPLPAWAQGEFSGLASTPEGRLGSASMSVTAAGKVSGKVIVNGTNVSFSAANYDIASKTVGETNLVAKIEGKLGKEAVTGGITVVASGATGTFAGAEMSLCRNVWKDKGAEPVPAEAQGLYTVKLGAGDRGTGYLSLTVDKKGAVKVAGKATDGTALSASATLMPGSGETRYFADVFAAPSAYKGGYVAGRLAWDAEGRVSSDGLDWTSFNPQSTTDYYAGGFDRGLSASGAWYSKTAKLLDYYATLDFEAENRGVGQSCWANLTVSVDQTGKKFVVDQKKTTPVQDKATKAWSYEGANDAALEFSFTQATGIWKGSFLWWLDEPKHASQKIPFEGIMVQGEDLEGFGTYDVPASYVPYDKKGQPQKEKAYKCKESVPVSFTEAE